MVRLWVVHRIGCRKEPAGRLEPSGLRLFVPELQWSCDSSLFCCSRRGNEAVLVFRRFPHPYVGGYIASKPPQQMIPHAQRVRDNCQGGVHRTAGDEETTIHDVKIVYIVSTAIQVQHGRCWIFPKFAGANLMAEAMHRHLGREITGLWCEVICLRHDMAAAPDVLQNSLPALNQTVEWLRIVFSVINYNALVPLDPHLVLRIGQVLSRKPPVNRVLRDLLNCERGIFEEVAKNSIDWWLTTEDLPDAK